MTKKTERSWENRLTQEPAERMMQFVESLSFDRRLYPYDIAGSIAHAGMLAAQGLIEEAEFKAIEQGLHGIEQEISAGRFVFDTRDEDIHMAIEAALIQRIGNPGRKLHTGRSRNDQVATDIRLWMRDEIELLLQLINAAQTALTQQADSYVDAVMPAYTHMQRAQPVSIAAYLLSFVEMLERDYTRLQDCAHRLNQSPLGSGAIAGSTLALDRQHTARTLGFDGFTRCSIDGVSDRDFCAEFIFACSLIGIHLSRLAEDWILYCSTEFGFIRLADAYCTSSSMMPQKKNPDVLELIRGKTGTVIGALMGLLTLLKGLPSGYNRDLQDDKVHVFAASDTIEACLHMVREVVAHTEFIPQAIARDLDQGFLDATALAEYLVRKGVPFRQAHGIVGALVSQCEPAGQRLCDLSLEQFRAQSMAIEEDVYETLGPVQVTQSYQSAGAGGIHQARELLNFWQTHLKKRCPSPKTP